MNSNVPESLAKRMRMINVIAAGAILLAVAGTEPGGHTAAVYRGCRGTTRKPCVCGRNWRSWTGCRRR